jgi:hypothetical protein
MFAILPALRGFYQKIEYNYKNAMPVSDSLSPYTSKLRPLRKSHEKKL